MDNNFKEKFPVFLKNNGFRLLLLAFVALIITRKDLDFRVNLSSPTRQKPQVEQPMPQQSAPKTEQSRISEKKSDDQEAEEQKSSLLPGTTKGEYVDMTQIGTYLKSKMTKAGKKAINSYIKRFSKVAIAEQEKYGVPASITLGQALLNSSAGTTALSQKGNNHFGMVCQDWTGESKVYPDGNCYRHYKNAWRSFRDHSQFITNGKFEELTQLAADDYERWAIELERINFKAPNDYAETLVHIIEEYDLTRFD